MADDFDELIAEARALGKASLHGAISGTPELYGSAAFFEAATDALVESTRVRRELGGACYFVEKDGAVVLVGMRRESRGKGTEVAIDPRWGSVLWHTHPGQSFSLAAFSDPDIAGAREAGRPLLVIGYQSASPDALGLTLASGDVRLLRLGVAARVCWPNGDIRPVRRYGKTGLPEALEEASFQVDRALGAAARAMTPLSHRLLGALRGAAEHLRKPRR